LAKDLKEAGVDVRVIVCQVHHIPQSIEPGLSEPMARAVPLVCAEIARQYLVAGLQSPVARDDVLTSD
jgi:hypothetical protein